MTIIWILRFNKSGLVCDLFYWCVFIQINGGNSSEHQIEVSNWERFLDDVVEARE